MNTNLTALNDAYSLVQSAMNAIDAADPNGNDALMSDAYDRLATAREEINRAIDAMEQEVSAD